ncbi:hypothetical protein JXJ21_07425 [candidate division KSB1 bacterium]|nr:hypothetical protein [candidate division KSB1 bacterium]
MKYIILTMGVVLLIPHFSFSKLLELQSFSPSDSISMQIDADPSEWRQAPVIELQKNALLLSAMNDSDFIYISLRCSNPFLAGKIRMRGVMLWFDLTGDKKKHFGMFYRGVPNRIRFAENEDSFWDVFTPEQRAKLNARWYEKQNAIRLVTADSSVSIPQNAPQGAQAAAADLGKGCFCEFKIPIVLSDTSDNQVAIAQNGAINLGVAPGKANRDAQSWQSRDDFSPAAYPDFPSSGRYTERRNVVDAARDALTWKESWIRIVLANPSQMH